jgi:hypothetical protein
MINYLLTIIEYTNTIKTALAIEFKKEKKKQNPSSAELSLSKPFLKTPS